MFNVPILKTLEKIGLVKTQKTHTIDPNETQTTKRENMTTNRAAAYEIHNPSFGDLTLDQQIEYGCNDWCADGDSGHPYYGTTAAQAEEIRATHNFQ